MPSPAKLRQAVREHRADDIVAILKDAPDLLADRDERGRNLLHLCCGVDVARRNLRPEPSLRTADVLIAAGLDLNQEAFREGTWRATPLWYAIARGRNLKLAEHLLRLGSDPNHCLWAAGYNDDSRAVRLLLKSGADVDPRVEDETPLLAAVKVSHFAPARVLLEHGADPDFQDSAGMSALHYMVKKGSAARHFALLLRHGARGDLANREGQTVAELLSRKRDPALRKVARTLAQRQA